MISDSGDSNAKWRRVITGNNHFQLLFSVQTFNDEVNLVFNKPSQRSPNILCGGSVRMSKKRSDKI